MLVILTPSISPIIVAPIPPTIKPPYFFCQNDFPVTIDGFVFNQPGSYNQTLTSALGCDSTVQYLILPKPQTPGFLDTMLCPGVCLMIQDSIICSRGSSQLVLPGIAANGCDSIINVNITDRTDSCQYVFGRIVDDYNGNCIQENGEPTVQQGSLFLIASDTTIIPIDSNGNFYLGGLGHGTYTLHYDAGIQGFQPCDNDINFTLDANSQFFEKDFYLTGPERCYDLSVFLGINYLQRCTTNRYFVSYCNNGNATAGGAYIDVELDPFMTYVGSSRPYEFIDGQVIRFDLGNVGPDICGGFTIDVDLNCEFTLDGMTHCSEAIIYPNLPCVPSPAWSGASLDIFGKCEGDSVKFVVQNVGEQVSRPNINYLIIEDQVVLKDTVFARTTSGLQPGERREIAFFANGSTYRMELEQEPFHPGKREPLVTYVEGCKSGGGTNFSIGYVGSYGVGSDDKTHDVECKVTGDFQYVIDKNCVPAGYGPDHLIAPNVQLEYKIHFQNTQNDSVNRVVIRDTLSDLFDFASFTPGASSHAYTVNWVASNVVEFVFDPIQLPPAATSLMNSRGFVNFRIDQLENNKQGSTILNTAYVSLEEGPYEMTNIYFHNVVTQEITGSKSVNLCDGNLYNGLVLTTDTFLIDTFRYYLYDSIEVTEVTIIPLDFTQIQDGICEGSSLEFGGINISEAGTYFDTLQNRNGCDSIVELELMLLQGSSEMVHTEICNGDNYSWEGMSLDAAGTYSVTYPNKNGCDSTLTLILDLILESVENIDTAICRGDSIEIAGDFYSREGDFTIELQTVNGCDSLINLHIERLSNYRETIVTGICEGDFYVFEQDTLTEAGSYEYTYPYQNGCDSILELMLTVHPIYESQVDTILKKYENFLGLEVLNDTAFTRIYESVSGCDSTIHYNIVVDFSSVIQPASPGEEIKIIPNPNDGLFIVELELKTPDYVEFKILDWNGKEVGYKKVKDKLQAGKNTIKFNEPDLVPGAYLMVIKDKQGVRVRQFLKY
ncbi:MAG: T9SS type A sorting domain-containing protein [Saprospiraceae bacterium]